MCNNFIFTNCLSSLVILIWFTILFKESDCVLHIRDLVVPNLVENGTRSSIVLDCDYEFDDPSSRTGLVIKWFFNNNPTPVYQWIVGKKPQAFGIFKNKLNLLHRASNDDAKAYRAMMIQNPSIELTGEYMCLVSNFDTEVSAKEKMTVYVTEGEKKLIVDETIDNKTERADKIRIKCEATELYPEPEMFIKMNNAILDANVNKDRDNDTSLYNIDAFAEVDVKTLKSDVSFDCELSIPEANYTVHEYKTYELNNSASSFLNDHGLPFLLFGISIVHVLRL